MNTVTLSPKFQVVIPTAIRKELNLIPGMKFRVLRHGDRVELVTIRPIKSMRGMDTGRSREE